MRQNSCARTDGNFAILCSARFAPVAPNLLRDIQVHHLYIGITLKIPLPKAAIIGVCAQMTLIKRLNDNIATLPLLQNTLIR